MFSIFATDKSDWQFNPKTGAMVAAGSDGAVGPVFTLRPLDFFEYQRALGAKEGTDRLAVVFKTGILAIDGDTAQIKAFIDRPNRTVGGAVFDVLWAESGGN